MPVHLTNRFAGSPTIAQVREGGRKLSSDSRFIACRYSVASSPHEADAGYRICRVHLQQRLEHGRGGCTTAFDPVIVLGEESLADAFPRHVRFHELNYAELLTATSRIICSLKAPYEYELVSVNSTVVDAIYLLGYWTQMGLAKFEGPALNKISNLLRLNWASERVATTFSLAPFTHLQMPSDSQDFLVNAHVYAVAVSYPLLEATSRRSLRTFIDSEGLVLSAFPRSNGSSYVVGKFCSSVKDLLLFSTSPGSGLSAHLRTCLGSAIASFDETRDLVTGAEEIYRLRNGWAHGGEGIALYGLKLSLLACLILGHTLFPSYAVLQARVLNYLESTPAIPGAKYLFPPFPELFRSSKFWTEYDEDIVRRSRSASSS